MSRHFIGSLTIVRARIAEKRLVATVRDRPGLKTNALARIVDAARSNTRERLERLRARGLIEKDAEGRWGPEGAAERNAAPAVAAFELAAEPEADRVDPRPATVLWAKSIASYDRRETTFIEGRRYG
jgi:hypothetical protein